MDNIVHFEFMYGFCSYLCYLMTNTSAICITVLCITNVYLFFKRYVLLKNKGRYDDEKDQEYDKLIRVNLYSMVVMTFICFVLYVLSAYYRVTLLVYNVPADELLRFSTY